jgi:hypothetical protein
MYTHFEKEMVGHVVHMAKNKNAYKVLKDKPEERRPFERTRHR